MAETTLPIYVTDTHALIWLMNDSARLGEKAAAAFSAVDQGQALLIVPAIVLAELIFLVERGRVAIDLDQTLQRLHAHPAIETVGLSWPTVLALRSTTTVPEMHDRLIVCEALLHNATLITRDVTITASALVPTIW